MTKVLYVEDEVLLALAMEGALIDAGCTVALAHDGEEGVRRALEFAPEIIITDYMMPNMDGPEMVRILDQKGIRVPVILATAVPERDLDPQIADRVDLYLGKPYTEEELISAFKRLSRDF